MSAFGGIGRRGQTHPGSICGVLPAPLQSRQRLMVHSSESDALQTQSADQSWWCSELFPAGNPIWGDK